MSQAIVNQVLETQNEFNIKLFILVVLFIYSIGAIWYSNQLNADSYFGQIIKYLLFKLPAGVFLFFFPLYSVFLYNAISAEILLIFVWSFYGIFSVILFVAFIAFGTKWALNFVGIDWKSHRDFKLNKYNG